MKQRRLNDFVKGLNVKMFQTTMGVSVKINIRFDLLYAEFMKHSKDGKNLNVLCLPRTRIGDGLTTHYVIIDTKPNKDMNQFEARGHFGVGAIDSQRQDPDIWNEDIEDPNYEPPKF